MRPTGSAPRSNEKFHLSRHDKKIEQRADDFMDVFKNLVLQTFLWVKGTLSRRFSQGDARWKAKSCIDICWA